MFAASGKVLFLHGWSSDGGRKTSFMRLLGYDVMTPKLSNWSFRRAVRTAQAAADDFRPDVIVGSSRGGAVAMSLDNKETPVILLAPAWRTCGVKPRVRASTGEVIHSRHDRVVPIMDSIELCRLNPAIHLVVAGGDHRLNDQEARWALASALASMVPHWPTGHARTNSR